MHLPGASSPPFPSTEPDAEAARSHGGDRVHARDNVPVTRAALGSAVVAAGAIAVAPAIPFVVRSPVVVATLGIWTGAVGWALIVAARKHGRRRLSGVAAMGIVGITLALLATTELEAIRMSGHRPALTWNIDWRYALNHAQAIARTGGVDVALDYAGVRIKYHVGPAWFAGAAARSFGIPVSTVLFGLVPVLCTLTFALAAVAILRARGVKGSTALGATGLVMALPGVAYILPLATYCLVVPTCRTSPALWTFSHEIALNTYHALAVGMAALALLLDSEPSRTRTVLGSVGLGTLVMIKPQSFVGYGLLAGLAAVGYLLGIRGFQPRTGRILAAAIGAVVIAGALLSAFPHIEGRFGPPVWAPGHTPFPFSEDRNVPTAVAVIAMLGARRYLRRNPAIRTLLLTAAAGLFGLAAFWALVHFPVRPAIVTQMVEVGADPLGRADFANSLQPLRLLVALLGIAALIETASRMSIWRRGLAFCVGWATVTSPLLFIVPALIAPQDAYEADEDVGLLEVLQALPDGGGLLIASDLADAAENHARPLRGFRLTGLTGRPFYVANLQYNHHAEPDATRRMIALRTFFGSPWSAWHTRWLAETGIEGVLVNSRCRPVWSGHPGASLRQVAKSGQWTAFVVTSANEPGQTQDVAAPSWTDMTPAYGRSECLTGLRADASAGRPAEVSVKSDTDDGSVPSMARGQR